MVDQAWLCAADAQQLSGAFAEGAVLPTDVLTACLARVEQRDAQLGVCNHRLELPQLLEVAQAAAERWRDGVPFSPLDGIPFGVKANIAVRGQPWHGGIRAFRERLAAEDAACVARLRAAGMIPVALFNMHEGALGVTSANPAFQTTRNPHNPAHIPGGSSGGSAVAVAAGMVPIALGTDSLGSVRLPSALCGVVGFKPAQGEVPLDGVMPLSPQLDHVGVHARSVADLAQVTALLVSGPSSQSPQFRVAEAGSVGRLQGRGEPLRDLRGTQPPARSRPARMGWLLGPQLPIDESVSQAFFRLLQQQGVSDVLDWSDLDLSTLRRAGLLICERDAAYHFAAALRDHPNGFSETLRQMLAWAAKQPDEKVLRAESRLAQARRRLCEDLADALLLSPTTPHVAPPCGGATPTTLADLTAPAAIAGLPAISLPMGMGIKNLPMGLQITGTNSREVLEAARHHFPGVAAIAGVPGDLGPLPRSQSG